MKQVITIPKKLLKEGELVMIPRSEYEEVLRWKKIIPQVKASKSEKRALGQGRNEIAKGSHLTLKQLKNELAS